MFGVTIYYLFYLLSVALQLSAGIILLNNIKADKETVAREYHKQFIVNYGGSDGKSKNIGGILDTAKTVLLNRIAFFFLTFGYGLGVIADAGEVNKWISLVIVLLLSFGIKKLADIFAKSRANKYIDITDEDGAVENMFSIVDNIEK